MYLDSNANRPPVKELINRNKASVLIHRPFTKTLCASFCLRVFFFFSVTLDSVMRVHIDGYMRERQSSKERERETKGWYKQKKEASAR